MPTIITISSANALGYRPLPEYHNRGKMKSSEYWRQFWLNRKVIRFTQYQWRVKQLLAYPYYTERLTAQERAAMEIRIERPGNTYKMIGLWLGVSSVRARELVTSVERKFRLPHDYTSNFNPPLPTGC